MSRRTVPALPLAVFALAALSPGARAQAPRVERALDELPPVIGTDALLTVVSEKPGALRWGVDGWRLPAPVLRPAGTVVVDAGAVETPLAGPDLDGRYRATIGPFRQGVGAVDLVVRHADGTWGAQRGRDARVEVRAGTPSRRRPITIGRGPALGRANGVTWHEDFQDWEYLDCRGLDPADDARDLGDGRSAARDLVALYTRREGDAFFLRADVLDLGLGDEQRALDVVFLIDCAPGGQQHLPDFVHGRAGTGWELALTVRDEQRASLVDATWRAAPGHLGTHVRADLDAVETGVSLAALRAAGWDGQRPLAVACYTLKDGDPRPADAFTEASLDDGSVDAFVPEDRLGGTAKWSSILHGNQAVQPLRWLHDLVESTRLRTPSGNPTGYLRALDAHARFRVPVNIHVSGTLAATAEWGARGFNDRLRGFLDGRPETGQGALIGGVLAEHIMPYFENGRSAHGGEGMNAASVRLNDELLDRLYGGPSRSVFWIPERVVRGSTLWDVVADAQGRRNGYAFTVLDQVTHLARWFGRADAHSRNGHKINRINGVSCFLINDDADQWKFANTDGGLWVWSRRELVGKALDPDQEQLVLVFDDWEAFAGRSFTSFGVGSDNPDNYERNVRWIANHPWIQAVTLEDVAAWGWTPVERGLRPDLSLETYEWLDHATQGSYDQWVWGSPQEESFADFHPEVARGRRTTKRLGEGGLPGTILGDAWRAVAQAPRGRLADLAAAVYSVAVFETAWHDEDMHDYLSKDAQGRYLHPDTTWDPVAGWARAMQARTGDAAIVAAAARWAAAPPPQTRAWREDVDEDGEAELVVADARGFYVLEDDGGRLVFAAVRDPQTGRADAVVCGLLQVTGDEARRDHEPDHEETPVRPHGLVDWWATGARRRYVNEAYAVEQVAQGWRLRSPDGHVTKTVTLRDGRLTVEYGLTPQAGTLFVRTGLSPATFDLLCGAELRHATRPDGGITAEATGAHGGRVGLSVVPGPGARVNPFAQFGGGGARGVPFAHLVEVEGQGSFAFVLEPTLR